MRCPRAAALCIVAAALCIVAAIAPAGLSAQVPATSTNTTGVSAGAAFETYRFSDSEAIGIESITLITTPFAAGARLTDRLSMTVRGAWARGALGLADGSESTLTGLTDTEVRATFVGGDDRITFTAVALLPTGQNLLAPDEVQVAGVVAADVLPLRISNWGSGGGVGGSVAFAVPVGEFGAGLSVGYVVAREFEPVETTPSFVYRPGNQLHVTAALDRSVGTTGKFGLRASVLTYGQDRANDANLYSAGTRFEAVASWAFAAGPRSNAIVWGGAHHRDAGAFEDPAAGTDVSPASTILFAGAALRMPFGAGILQPSLDVRAVTGSDGVSRGYIGGAGIAAELPAGSVVVSPVVRARIGNVETATSAKSGVVGADIGMTIRFGAS